MAETRSVVTRFRVEYQQAQRGLEAIGSAAGKTADQVEQAGRSLESASRRQEDAAGRLRAAEANLEEVKRKNAEGSSRVVSAEERVAKSRRDLEVATEQATSAQRDYTSALTSSSDAASRSSSPFQRLAQSARDNEQAWTTAGTALTAYGTAVVGVGALAARTGIQYNTLQQTSRAALTSITGSAKDANRQMDALDDFARNSPFAKDTFIKAQQQMLGFGIESKKVIPYLDSIQNAVAATGGSNQDISELTRIMSQISSSAKITAEDLNQFGERGIDAATLIGSQMGKTGAQIREDITDGALDAGVALDALSRGMEERFEGAAANVKNTFLGATDRVKAAWRDLSSSLMEPLVGSEGGGLAIEGLNKLADAMREFEGLPDPLRNTATSVGLLSGAASLAAGGFLLLAPRILETREAFKALAGQNDLIGKTARGMGRIGPEVTKAAAAIAAAVVAWQALDRTIDAVTGQTTPKIADLTKEMEGLAATGREASGALDEAFAGGSNSWITNTLLGTGAVSDLDDAFEELSRNQGKIGKITLALQKIQPGTQALESAAEGVKQYDEALVELTEGGSSDKAAEAFDKVASRLVDQGHDIDYVVEQFSGYKSSLEATANALDVTGLTVEDYANWMRGEVPEAVQVAAEANEEFSEGLAGLAPAAEEAAEGLGVLSAEAVEAQDYLQEVAEGLVESGDGFLNFAEKATDAETSLRSWIDSMEEQIDAQQNWFGNLESLMDRGVSQEFIDFLMSLGEEGAFRVKQLADASDDELARAVEAFEDGTTAASDFAHSVAGIPDIDLEADTTELMSQVWFAEQRLIELGEMEPSPVVDAQITALEENIRIAKEQLGDLDNDEAHPLVGVSGADESKGKVEGVHDALLALPPDTDPKVDVDDEPARSTMESLWTWIRGKTIFFKTEAQKTQSSENNPTGQSGSSSGFATGGAIRGPGSGTSDSILARLSNGEHVWTAAEVKRAGGHDAIYRMRQEVLRGNIPAFAGGGAVQRAKRRLDDAEADLARINRSKGDRTAEDRRREAAQRRIEAARESLRKAEEAKARADRLRQQQQELRTDIRRGTIRDRVTGGLSGGYSAIDELMRLSKNEDLSRGSRNRARTSSSRFESDLRRLYSRAERIDEKLETAQEKAKELEGIQRSVSSGISGRAYDLDVTSQWSQNSSGQWEQTSGVSGVRTNAAAAAARVKTLAKRLQQLQQMGYAGAILQEVAQAGSIEASIQMADALLQGSRADVKSINASYASIQKWSDQAGKYVTGGFYKGGIDAADGVVKGLESQKSSVESQIAKLAKSIEDTFKRVLGIRSPSTVMKKLGENVGEGLRDGILGSLAEVDSASQSLASAATPRMPEVTFRTLDARVSAPGPQASGGVSAAQDGTSSGLGGRGRASAPLDSYEALGEAREALEASYASMSATTQEHQALMQESTELSQMAMRDATLTYQTETSAAVAAQQESSLVATRENQAQTLATVSEHQAQSLATVTSQQNQMFENLRATQAAMLENTRTQQEEMYKSTSSRFSAMRVTASDETSTLRDDVVENARTMRTSYSDQLRSMESRNDEGFKNMKSGGVSAFRGMREGIGEQMDRAHPALVSDLNRLIRVFSRFTSSVNTAFGDVGVKLDSPKTLEFASGGVLPGYTPGRDVHHFRSPSAGDLYLSGGESIMRPEFTRAVGGERGVRELNALARQGRFGDMNSSLHTAMYANGGVLPPIKGLNAFADSGVWRSLFGAVQERFPDVRLHSAYRAGAITATGNRSMHGQGKAIDITPRMDIAEWIRENYGGGTRELIFSPMGSRQINRGRNHYYTGVTRSMHFDHIHWAVEQALKGVMPYTGDGTYSGGAPVHPFLDKAGVGAGADLEKSYRQAARKLLSGIMDTHLAQLGGMNPTMKALGTSVMKQASSGLVDKAGEYGESMKFVMPGGEGVERWRDTVIQALRYAGLPQTDDYVNAWLRQIKSESGGRPDVVQGIRDVNSGGNEAVGLVQVIPSTFAAFRDKSLPNDRTHPLANLVAGMNWAKYKANRQGRDMLSFIGHGHGYESGTRSARRGLAIVGEDGPEVVEFQGGERVYSNPETNRLLKINAQPQASGLSARDLTSLLAASQSGSQRDLASALNGMKVTLVVDGKPMAAHINATVASGYSESRSRLSKSSSKVGAR